jgi:hypothetical protein
MSLFSSKQGRLAAMQSLTSAQDTQRQIASALYGGQGSALAAIGQAQPDRLAALQGGYDTASGFYQRARDLYNPYAETGLQAWNQTADAAGVNGAGGYDRARGAFQASPGYQWNVSQALDQTNRAAGAAGELYSGNTASALQDRASNLANQEYGTYYDRLQGISDRGYNAVGAQAGIDQGQGGLAYQHGSDVSGVYGDTAGQKAGIYTNTAQGVGGSLANLGQQTIDAYGNVVKAGQQAETNKLNLGIAGLGAAATIGGAAFAGPVGAAGGAALTAALKKWADSKSPPP